MLQVRIKQATRAAENLCSGHNVIRRYDQIPKLFSGGS
jgi:hypothetical protein